LRLESLLARSWTVSMPEAEMTLPLAADVPSVIAWAPWPWSWSRSLPPAPVTMWLAATEVRATKKLSSPDPPAA
jgi:hypothetical protein